MEARVLGTQNLKPEIMQRIEGLDEESLLLLHRLLLDLEKDRLWRELSKEVEADRLAGRFDRLSDIIRETRGSFGIRFIGRITNG